MNIEVTYAAYTLVSIALTIWVARTLFNSGRVFLVEVFAGNEGLADSVNHLLVVGFYLINLGFVALALKIEGELGTTRLAIEALAEKLGTVMLVLGAMHFLNLIVFSRVRAMQRTNRQKDRWLELQQAVPPPRI